MKRFAVCGEPIAHSFSPFIHKQLFIKNNIEVNYARILTNNPQQVIQFFNQFDLSGINITSPLKKSIIPYCDSITDDAKEIGAVNTIIKHKEQLLGFNTD
jgi:shikimate 5-dehydrogenase